jgi:hypothetical protein
LLPDFGSFYAQTVGILPVHLLVAGANPIVAQSAKNLFAVSFELEHSGQRMLGTIESVGTRADALKVAQELVTIGVYCQARPDLAYTTLETNERVIPFRLYQEPELLSQEACKRIQTAEAKRARKAAKRQISS